MCRLETTDVENPHEGCRPAILLVSFLVCFALQTSTGAGQTVATTGAISGKVTDSTGAGLPAVAVATSSDALMGSRTAVTGADGRYRFPALPAGDYTVVFTRDGFGTVRREAVHVGIAFTASVDAELELAALREDVIVARGAAPIDRQSTAIAQNFDARQLADLPGSRSIFASWPPRPPIRVARFEVGGAAATPEALTARLARSAPIRPMVEGIIVSGIFPAGFIVELRGVRGGLGRHGRTQCRVAVAGRADAVHDEGGRQPVPRHGLCRLREPRLAVVQHRRPADSPRCVRRRWVVAARSQSPVALP